MLISACLISLPLYYIAPGRSAVTGSKDDGDNDDKFLPGSSFYRQTVKRWLFLQDKIFVNRYQLTEINIPVIFCQACWLKLCMNFA